MKIGITGMREGPGLSSCDNTMREKVFLDPRERKWQETSEIYVMGCIRFVLFTQYCQYCTVNEWGGRDA